MAKTLKFTFAPFLFTKTENTIPQTRMHSSRMCTGRSLTICQSLLPGGVCSRGVSAPRGCLLWGCLLRGCVCSQGVCFRGVSVPRGVSAGGCTCSRGLSVGGCLLPGVVCSQGGVWVSQHALRQFKPKHPL